MSLFAIGDLHLSLGTEKSMDVFGGRWQNYIDKIQKGFADVVSEDDTTVLCGDLSWGMTIEESAEDFKFIDSLPGKKIIVKGNHDYWWTTTTKVSNFFQENDIKSIDILRNNSFVYNDSVAICGTRGWFFEEEGEAHDQKILNRECMRLEASLQSAGDLPKMVFLHYPPIYINYECEEILKILEQYNVTRCFYGHIHSWGCASAFNGSRNGTEFKLVSADYLNFIPFKVM